jgi:hypothetical protein
MLVVLDFELVKNEEMGWKNGPYPVNGSKERDDDSTVSELQRLDEIK